MALILVDRIRLIRPGPEARVRSEPRRTHAGLELRPRDGDVRLPRIEVPPRPLAMGEGDGPAEDVEPSAANVAGPSGERVEVAVILNLPRVLPAVLGRVPSFLPPDP